MQEKKTTQDSASNPQADKQVEEARQAKLKHYQEGQKQGEEQAKAAKDRAPGATPEQIKAHEEAIRTAEPVAPWQNPPANTPRVEILPTEPPSTQAQQGTKPR